MVRDALWVIVCAVATILLRRRLAMPMTHGSAAWGRPHESFIGVPEPGAVFIGYDRGKAVILRHQAALQHGVIIGGTGTGKSRGYFFPNAASCRRTSLVCTDPKGELWRYTSGLHDRAERYAPTEPNASACFNWIPLCRNARTAELAARAIMESGNTHHTDQAWIDTETAFLAGVFSHAATLKEPTPLTAYRLFTTQSLESLVHELLSSESQAAREQAVIFQHTSERMRGVIVPVVAARLQFMRDAAVTRFTSASLEPPHFATLREQPTAIYFCLREHDIARLRPLTSLFFTLLLDELASMEEAKIPVIMLFDEFANIGTIPGFETTISLARGRGVSLWLGLQSLSQLEARYGSANARTILTNCGTKIALHGLDFESADYISKTLGTTTVTTPQHSRQHRRGDVLLPSARTHGETASARPLLTPDEVRRLCSNEALVITGNHHPMKLEKIYYDQPPKEAPAPSLGLPHALSFSAHQAEEPNNEAAVPRRAGGLRTL